MAQQIALTPGAITTIAGTGAAGESSNGTPATGSNAGKIEPIYSIAVSSSGDIYFAESTSYIKVLYNGGTGAAAILNANSVTSPVVGDIYTVAGTGTAAAGTDKGLSTASAVSAPRGLAVDSNGNLFIADSGNNKVRIVYAAGTAASSLIGLENSGTTATVGYIYTIAGGGTGANGTLASSQGLNSPRGLYVDSADDLYIADISNNAVRLVYNGGSLAYTLLNKEGYTAPVSGTGNGDEYIIAGTAVLVTSDSGDGALGYSSGATTPATTSVNGPSAVGVNPTTGDVYITEFGANKVRKVNGTTGIVSTVGGPASGIANPAGNIGDGGLATAAEFDGQRGIWVDAGGNIYLADSSYNVTPLTTCIRKIDASGYINTIAGINGTNGSTVATTDNVNATSTTLTAPFDVVLDASGNLYIADSYDYRIRKVNISAAIAGTTATAGVYSGSFAFGSVGVGSTSTGAKATISNISAASLTPGSISIPAEFTQITGNAIAGTLDCSTASAIAPGESCTLDLAYAPTSTGASSGTATVSYTSGTTDTVSIALSGTGVQVATTTTLTATSLTPSLGQSVTFTAMVTATSGTPTGSVTFYDGSTAISGAVLLNGGVATYSTSSLALGSHSISAFYNGTSGYATSQGSLTVNVINGVATTTLLSVSTTTPTLGQSVTFIATVTGTGGTPTGTVNFLDGTTVLATAQPMTAGVANFTTSALAVGGHSITAVYSGDSTFTGSTSAATTVTVTGSMISTSSALSASTATPTIGQSVTFTATVTAASGTPTGTMNFLDGTTVLATAEPMIAGVAIFTTTALAVGSHSITAVYNGTTGFLTSTSSAVTVTVASASTGPVPLLAITPGTMTTVAGNGTKGETGNGAAATSAEITGPQGVAIDGSGNLYIADSNSTAGTQSLIREVSASTGYISTYSGGSGTACAGATAYAACGDGGPVANATFGAISGSKYGAYTLVFDSNGNLYIADTYDNRFRIVFAGGTGTMNMLSALGITSPIAGYIYTFAGSGCTSSCTAYTAGMLANTIEFSANGPRGIAVDSAGNIYVSDQAGNKVYIIYAAAGNSATTAILTGEGYTAPFVAGGIYLIAGTGSSTETANVEGSLGKNYAINSPAGIGLDPSGNLYIETYGSNKILKLAANGTIIHIAGNGTAGFSGDGNPINTTTTEFGANVRGLVTDAAGNVYVVDTNNEEVRKIDGNGNLYSVAGVGGAAGAYSGDNGNATAAKIFGPYSATIDAAGNLYIADTSNNRVRKVYVAAANGSSGGGFAFGSVATGTTSEGQIAILSNSGGATLTLSGISIPNGYKQVTSGGTDCTSTTSLAPATGCNLDLAFAPASAGAGTATATVASNGGSVSIALSGTGVVAATTTTALTALSAAPSFGSSVTFTVTVSSTGGTPTGSVNLYDGSTLLSTLTLVSGVATLTTSSLAVGSHSITAVYAGVAAFGSSTSPAVVVVVANTGVTSTTTLTATPVAITFGQTVTLTVTVTSSASNPPTGTVTISDNGTVIATPMLVSGGATFSTTTLPLGSNVITASYPGDPNNQASTATPVTISVTSSVLRIGVIPGIISTVINTAGTAGSTGNGGLATSAYLSAPYVARSDASGNFYVSDSTNQIRMVYAGGAAATALLAAESINSPTAGYIYTIAGTGTTCSAPTANCGDGATASLAQLDAARGLAIDAAGDVFISDSGDNRIRLIYNGGTAAAAILNAESVTSPVVGNIYTIAGGGTGAANTLANNQALSSTRGVYVDSLGNVFIANLGSNKVLVIFVSGTAVSNLITTENPGVTPTVGDMYVIAGSGSSTYSGDGALAASAGVNSPADIGFDASGNFYITEFGDNRVRRVSAATGYISTIAGIGTAGFTGDGAAATAAQLSSPRGIWVEASGNVYIADAANGRIRKIDGSGNINTIVGGGSVEGDGGTATAALLNTPYSVTFDNLGNLLIATDGDNRVRSVNAVNSAIAFANTALGTSSAGQVVTLTNTGNQTITLNSINIPSGYAQIPSGGTDCTSTTTLAAGSSCILDVAFVPTTATAYPGTITVTSNAATVSITLSGTGVVGSTATALSASSTNPTVNQSVTFTAAVTSTAGTPTGTVKFYDGSTLLSTQTLSSGVASCSISILLAGSHNITAVYGGAAGFTTSTSAAVVVVVMGNGAVSTTVLTASTGTANLGQSVTLNATVTTVASYPPTGNVSIYDNGILLGSPSIASGVATLSTNALPLGSNIISASYFGDANNLASYSAPVTVTVSVVQVAAIPGIISTVIGTGIAGSTGNGGSATSATINLPFNARSDAAGNLYVTDSSNTVRKVAASTGIISAFAGTGTSGSSGDGGSATSATINAARGLAIDSAGNVYISDTGNNKIRIVYAGGVSAAAILGAEGVTAPVIGDIYTIAGGGTGANGTLANKQALNSPRGVFVDSFGNLYIADIGNNIVRVVYASGNAVSSLITLENPTALTPTVGAMYVLAGSGSSTDSGDGALAAHAGINGPASVGVDASGNLYTVEFGGNKVRELTASTGFISTIAGDGIATSTSNPLGDGGSATAASFSSPRDIWVDGGGNIYIADCSNNRIRKIDGSGNITTIAGGGSSTGDSGAATSALVNEPYSIALDNAGNLLTATYGDSRVRSVNAADSVLAFPNTTIGSTSTPQSILLANIGGQPIIPSAFSVPAGFTQAAGVSTDCGIGSAIAPGGTCTLRFSFLPTQSGPATGTVKVTTNATNAPLGVVSVQMSALGSNPNTMPSAVTLTTTPSGGGVDMGQTVTLTATVVSAGSSVISIPSGTVVFQSGLNVLGTATLNSSGVATLAVSTFPLGTSVVTAVYSGDTVYQPSYASSVTITVYTGPGDFTLTGGGTTTTVSAGETAYYVFSYTTTSGFDQTITFTCSGLPANAGCLFTPTLLTPIIGAKPTNFSLAISTQTSNAPNGPHARSGDSPMSRHLAAPLLALLLGVPLCLIGARRKLRRAMFLFLLCICTSGLFTGCSNSESYTTALTPAGIYIITITGTAGTDIHTTTVTLVVQ
jgi:hypothetical protein